MLKTQKNKKFHSTKANHVHLLFMKTFKVIAIDGYSSCGKSTLAKELAKKLNYIYIDSGAMYRAVTLYFLNHHINLSNNQEVMDALENISIEFANNILLLNGNDVSNALREMSVSENVSSVSANHIVRQKMVELQQVFGRHNNIVMDGRDIGTTVFPEAELKLFMTADPKIRAERRYQELLKMGQKVTFKEVFDNLEKRDFYDTNRAISPLIQAHDAIILDNSHLTPQDQLDFTLNCLKQLYWFPD